MTDDDEYKMQCEKDVLISMLKSEFNKGYEQGKKDGRKEGIEKVVSIMNKLNPTSRMAILIKKDLMKGD